MNFLDQLNRDGGLEKSLLADIREALDSAASELGAGRRNEPLAARLVELAGIGAEGSGDPATLPRRAALAATLKGIAARLKSS